MAKKFNQDNSAIDNNTETKYFIIFTLFSNVLKCMEEIKK